jgi:hypothetical protein
MKPIRPKKSQVVKYFFSSTSPFRDFQSPVGAGDTTTYELQNAPFHKELKTVEKEAITLIEEYASENGIVNIIEVTFRLVARAEQPKARLVYLDNV